MTDVIIIGGGASGMLAALTAAESGHSVLLLERQSRVGRKLLATGNGRCNLTNYHAAPDRYHGEDGTFCAHALQEFDVGATLQYFASLGLLTVSEDSGRVYPMSNMAGSVLDVLRYALERPGIEVRTGQVVTAVKPTAEGFAVKTETDVFAARKVILAAGGGAGSKVGGVMDGYRLAKALGHHRTVLYPSLVQLKTDPTYPRAVSYTHLDTVKTVVSHPQALRQCDGYIKRHGYATETYSNTALAAAHVRDVNDPALAAIASEEAAEVFGCLLYTSKGKSALEVVQACSFLLYRFRQQLFLQ